jgi:hypothetical protein
MITRYRLELEAYPNAMLQATVGAIKLKDAVKLTFDVVGLTEAA